MTQRRKAGCRQLNMWHQKRDPFVGSQAPPHRGILILKCPPFHHKIMCQNTRSRQTRPAHFNFLFVCQTAGELPNMSAASQREALAVGERIVPRGGGGKPTTTTLRRKKRKKKEKTNGIRESRTEFLSTENACHIIGWAPPADVEIVK